MARASIQHMQSDKLRKSSAPISGHHATQQAGSLSASAGSDLWRSTQPRTGAESIPHIQQMLMATGSCIVKSVGRDASKRQTRKAPRFRELEVCEASDAVDTSTNTTMRQYLRQERRYYAETTWCEVTHKRPPGQALPASNGHET